MSIFSHSLRCRLFLFLVWALQTNLCHGETATTAALDLRSFGWQPQGQKRTVWPSIAVDRDRRVVVSYAIRVRPHLVTRAKPSLDLRIVRFSEDGRLDLSLSLPTHLADNNGIYLSDSGQIIARANDRLQLYQEDLKAWNVLAECGPGCSVWQSVSRSTLVLRNGYHAPLLVMRFSPVLRLEKCDSISKSNSTRYYPQAITDEFAYYSGSENLQQFTYRWPFCEYEDRVEMPLRPGGNWDVLNDHSFVFYPYDPHNDRRTVKVVSSDGRVVFQSVNGKHEYARGTWSPTRSSERGSRIAVDIVTLRGGNSALDISGHPTARRIAVYDIELQKELASIPVIAKYHNPFEFGFDLSPDGRRLAILEKGTLKVIGLDGKHIGSGMGSKIPAPERK